MNPENSRCLHYDRESNTSLFEVIHHRGQPALNCTQCGTKVSFRKVSAMLEATAAILGLLKDRYAWDFQGRSMRRAVEYHLKRADSGKLPKNEESHHA